MFSIHQEDMMSVGIFRVHFRQEKMIISLVNAVLFIMFCFLMKKRSYIINDKESFEISRLTTSQFSRFLTHLVIECM